MVVGGVEHEGIPLVRRGETNVGGHKFVGMNIGVNFDAALLFSGLRMPPDAFDNEIGEERKGRRIDDWQAFDSLWRPAPSAVSGKHVLISGVQLSVDGFEDTFVTAQVGIRECGATRHGVINQKAEVQLRTSALFYVERKTFTGQQ